MVVLIVNSVIGNGSNFLSIEGLSRLKDAMEEGEYVELKTELGFEPDSEALPYSHQYNNDIADNNQYNGHMKGAMLLSILTDHNFSIVSQGAGAGNGGWLTTWTLMRS